MNERTPFVVEGILVTLALQQSLRSYKQLVYSYRKAQGDEWREHPSQSGAPRGSGTYLRGALVNSWHGLTKTSCMLIYAASSLNGL